MIKVENLTFKYKKRAVFTDFELTIEKGKIVGLLGKNGTGKSTLLYLMSGLLIPQKGRVMYNCTNASKRLPAMLRDIFIVPEEFSLPSMTLKSYMKINAPFYLKFSEEQLNENLKHFELDIIQRFGFVLSKDLREKRKRYFLLFLTMFGIMAVIFTILSSKRYLFEDIGSLLFSVFVNQKSLTGCSYEFQRE